MNNTFKWVLASILSIGILFSCKDDEFEEALNTVKTNHVHIDAQGRTIETVNPKSIPFIVEYIESQRLGYVNNGGSKSQDTQSNPFGTVDLNHIMALINDESADDKTYTFGMNTPDHITDEFANLIVRVINGEIIRAYINVYSPTEEYYLNNGLVFRTDYSGEMSSYSLEDSGIDLGRSATTGKLGEGLTAMKSRTLSEGISMSVTLSETCENPNDDDTTTDDNDSNNTTTGGTGNGSGNPDDPDGSNHTDTGTTDTNTDTGDTDGGGGAQECDFDIYTNCCNRNFCDPHGPRPPQPWCTGTNAVVIECNGDRTAQTGSGRNIDTSSCPDEDVIIINPPLIDDCDTSKEELEKVFPDAPDTTLELLADLINDFGADFDIDTKEELDHFLAQAGHETGGLDQLGTTENTNYTSVDRLLKIFSSFSDFPGDVSNPEKFFAPLYVGDPVAIANAAYCCQVGNGNEASGDGYNYRGRGIFQLTFKGNYQAFQNFYNDEYDPDIDVIANPNLIVDNDTLAVLSAMWFYKEEVLDRFTVDSSTTVKKVTRRINRRRIGLSERRSIFNKAKDSLTCQD